MRKLHNFLNRFQLQYCRTDPLVKVVVATTILLCTVTLVSLRLNQWNAEEKLELLQQQAAQLEQENQELAERIDALGTADSIRQIAREELDLVDPDTIIIEVED